MILPTTVKLAPQRRSQRLSGGGAGSAAAQPPGASGAQAAMGDSGDAVMARWLQSAGLQHLATSSAAGAGGADYRGGMPGLGGAGAGSMLSSLLMQVRFLCLPHSREMNA